MTHIKPSSPDGPIGLVKLENIQSEQEIMSPSGKSPFQIDESSTLTRIASQLSPLKFNIMQAKDRRCFVLFNIFTVAVQMAHYGYSFIIFSPLIDTYTEKYQWD